MSAPGHARIIAGVDEAGRGPLAGPVVAAAVILNEDSPISGLKDSKLLTARKREELFNLILSNSLAVGVGIVGYREIDRINILNASLKAMRIAVNKLSSIPDLIYIDGNRTVPKLPIEQIAIVKGDTFVPPIMAASIVAKVKRDEIMTLCSKRYGNYGFERHKGYATAGHLEALRKFGPCPIHRRSFEPVKGILSNNGEN